MLYKFYDYQNRANRAKKIFYGKEKSILSNTKIKVFSNNTFIIDLSYIFSKETIIFKLIVSNI